LFWIFIIFITSHGTNSSQKKKALRARDRARLGDEEYRRIERDKLRPLRASKRSPKPKTRIVLNNQPQPQPQAVKQPQANKSRKQKQKHHNNCKEYHN
jgi:hypothetical protein